MALADLLGVKLNQGFGKVSEDLDLIDNYGQMYGGNMGFHTQLALPPFGNALDTGTKDGKKINFAKGTTTLSFKFKGGVIVAVDSRASGGQYIMSEEVDKVLPINDSILGTMAGGAADCQYWNRVLSERCRIYELRNREKISVAAASKLLANILYNYKGMGISAGIMIAGWDKKGPGLYYVDDSGNRFKGEIFSIGSGSTYAYGVLDSGYRFDMSDEEAQELGRKAIYHATFRDAGSGGSVRVFHIKDGAWKKISHEDVMTLHYKYQDEKMSS